MSDAESLPTLPALDAFPRVSLLHAPTPYHKLPRISAQFPPHSLYIKRDDCSGLAFGGNKNRHLEFYLGDALSQGCDTLLGAGARQSNYMRLLAAAGAKLGLECHVQLENLGTTTAQVTAHSGNVLLERIFGATLHHHPSIADLDDPDAASDQALKSLANTLIRAGKKPYIIHLDPTHPPLGGLGYVGAAVELAQQFAKTQHRADLVITATGSGLTQAGLLVGFKLLGLDTVVLGICVRRNAELQRARVLAHCEKLFKLLGAENALPADAVWVDDTALGDGYGHASKSVRRAITCFAQMEGILSDPVYSGKAFCGALELLRSGELSQYPRITLLHTGGVTGLFARAADILYD